MTEYQYDYYCRCDDGDCTAEIQVWSDGQSVWLQVTPGHGSSEHERGVITLPPIVALELARRTTDSADAAAEGKSTIEGDADDEE